jgi:hypothetical protein
MDPINNVASATSVFVDEQLRQQHSEEMQGLVEDYTRLIQEIARARDQAIAETTRIAVERDAVKAARDAEVQRMEEAQQALEDTMVDLNRAKRRRQKEERTREEERSKLERRSKLELAASTTSLEKRLRQAERWAEDEHMDKNEAKRLNEELIERNRRDEKDASEAKASYEQWRVKYSAALAEKIDLVHQYAVSSHICLNPNVLTDYPSDILIAQPHLSR